MKFLSKISRFLYKKKLEKLRKKVSSKKNIDNSCFVDLGIEDTKEMQSKIEGLFQTFIKTPSKLYDYIKGAGTSVYKVKKLKIESGFILPKKGFEALYLNLILNKKISLQTPELFIIKEGESIYSLFYEFYRWYNYKAKSTGYNIETQEKFKHIFELTSSRKIDSLSYDDIIELKLAIKRDIEAIDFIKQIAIKNQSAKRALNKIQNKGSASI